MFERQFNHEDWMVGLIERKSVCSNKTVLTFKKVGRLGNQLSSYANMLVSQRLFNLNSYFPSKAVLENVQAFFENVTMPVLTENNSGACRVEVRSWAQFLMMWWCWNILSGWDSPSSQCLPWRTCGAVRLEEREICVTRPWSSHQRTTSINPIWAWFPSLVTLGLALRCSSRRGTGCSPVILGSARIVRNRPPDWGRDRERSRERP